MYDIDTCSKAGKRRVQKVSKECLKWGRRIQNSVFECEVDAAQCRKMINEMTKCVDLEHDRLRIYNLGNNYENRIFNISGNIIEYSDSFVI